MPRIHCTFPAKKFHLPANRSGEPLIYFAGNSLGLMPKAAKQVVEQELEDWAKLGVGAHLDAATPWYSYHETLRDPMARLVGAQPIEVICMNSLTVNLHLMMVTFYHPTKSRFKILMEDPAFPSDTYAIKTRSFITDLAKGGADSGAGAQWRVSPCEPKRFSI
jgi:Kynureninase